MGPSVLHGPHHVAQKSTSTGVCSDACSTSRSKLASPASNTNDSAPAFAPSGWVLKFMGKDVVVAASHSKAGFKPGIAITSAYLPAPTLPKSCECLSSAAACVVAAWIAYIGGMPACTMYTNSCAFSPCGYTPASVPNAILTPAL